MMKNIDAKGREWTTLAATDGVSRQATRIDGTWYCHAPWGFGRDQDARAKYPDTNAILDHLAGGLIMVLCPVDPRVLR